MSAQAVSFGEPKAEINAYLAAAAESRLACNFITARKSSAALSRRVDWFH